MSRVLSEWGVWYLDSSWHDEERWCLNFSPVSVVTDLSNDPPSIPLLDDLSLVFADMAPIFQRLVATGPVLIVPHPALDITHGASKWPSSVYNPLIAALKGFNPKSATFRQHYYPEGGWGWIIAACAVLVQILTSGLQMSFGILYIHILRSFDKDAVMTTGEAADNDNVLRLSSMFLQRGWELFVFQLVTVSLRSWWLSAGILMQNWTF